MKSLEELSKLSKTELVAILNEKRAIFDLNHAKNNRIQGMLHRKIGEKRETVERSKREQDEILTEYPGLKNLLTQDSPVINPEELRSEINSIRNNINKLKRKHKRVIEKIADLKETKTSQMSTFKNLQVEVEKLKGEAENQPSSDPKNEELLELSQIAKEYDEKKEEFDKLNSEIENLKKQIPRS